MGLGGDLVRELVRCVLQEVLEEEMTEALAVLRTAVDVRTLDTDLFKARLERFPDPAVPLHPLIATRAERRRPVNKNSRRAPPAESHSPSPRTPAGRH